MESLSKDPSPITKIIEMTVKLTQSRQESLLIADLGSESGRYQDTVDQIKSVIAQYGAHLSIDERNLLSIAYKNLTNTLRNSLRIMDNVEKSLVVDYSPDFKREMTLVRRQRETIEKELTGVCKDLTNLLDKQLLPAAGPGEETVFYCKMKGDYLRYLAEFGLRRDRERYGDQSLYAYKVAYKHAQNMLEPLHPTRLGLALNFSVFYHDVRRSPERACHLAKSAFDDAVQSLEQMHTIEALDQTVKDSLIILQLLRDDLILWAAELRNQ